jgi:hypothetical protein
MSITRSHRSSHHHRRHQVHQHRVRSPTTAPLCPSPCHVQTPATRYCPHPTGGRCHIATTPTSTWPSHRLRLLPIMCLTTTTTTSSASSTEAPIRGRRSCHPWATTITRCCRTGSRGHGGAAPRRLIPRVNARATAHQRDSVRLFELLGANHNHKTLSRITSPCAVKMKPCNADNPLFPTHHDHCACEFANKTHLIAFLQQPVRVASFADNPAETTWHRTNAGENTHAAFSRNPDHSPVPGIYALLSPPAPYQPDVESRLPTHPGQEPGCSHIGPMTRVPPQTQHPPV